MAQGHWGWCSAIGREVGEEKRGVVCGERVEGRGEESWREWIRKWRGDQDETRQRVLQCWMEKGLQCKTEECAQTRSERCEYGRGNGLWLSVTRYRLDKTDYALAPSCSLCWQVNWQVAHQKLFIGHSSIRHIHNSNSLIWLEVTHAHVLLHSCR